MSCEEVPLFRLRGVAKKKAIVVLNIGNGTQHSVAFPASDEGDQQSMGGLTPDQSRWSEVGRFHFRSEDGLEALSMQSLLLFTEKSALVARGN